MSKKTKKQKKRARLRKLQLQSKHQVSHKQEITLETTKKPSEEVYQHNHTLVANTVRDLRKTMIITLLLFTLEFLVFYANLKGNLTFFEGR